MLKKNSQKQSKKVGRQKDNSQLTLTAKAATNLLTNREITKLTIFHKIYVVCSFSMNFVFLAFYFAKSLFAKFAGFYARQLLLLQLLPIVCISHTHTHILFMRLCLCVCLGLLWQFR